MSKQLTQEQIDSLNAIYAKMEDDSLELEFFARGEWSYSNDTGNNVESRTKNIMVCDTPYRIKPKAPKKEYHVVEAAELPVHHFKNTLVNFDKDAGDYKVTCTVVFKSSEDAYDWYNFFRGISRIGNIITK